MQARCQELATVLAQDPGRRRIPVLACPQALAEAVNVLRKARTVVLISGFYIGRFSAWETDGPLGTLVLALALQQVGTRPIIFTDAGAVPIFAAGTQTLNLQLPLLGFEPGVAPTLDRLLQYEPDAVVAIERCGQAANGRYYNASGIEVTEQVAHFDPLFVGAKAAGIPTIAVGDGGNELGFGTRLHEAEILLGPEKWIACVSPASILIACGVSNWGGYALAVLLTWLKRSELACSEAMLKETLASMVAAGAIDGISGQRTLTVDGLPLTVELATFNQLQAALPPLAQVVVGEGN
ncbi:MAG: DUF4392 domain-containing protein [Firmicutes bacterium]|nr:DUF4392 domain-containing protein [Bacillota bacterium]